MTTAHDIQAVFPPEHARSANDLWDIVLPDDIVALNRATHSYYWGERCVGCDCRPSGEWSRFACKGWGYGKPVEAMAYEVYEGLRTAA